MKNLLDVINNIISFGAVEKQNLLDKELELTIYSNIANCYVNLELFEDSIEFCDKILDVEKTHVKANYRKAKALAGLFEFEFLYLGRHQHACIR